MAQWDMSASMLQTGCKVSTQLVTFLITIKKKKKLQSSDHQSCPQQAVVIGSGKSIYQYLPEQNMRDISAL